MDDIDRAVLRCLRENGRISNRELARRINLTPSATLKRVRHLEEAGVITGCAVRLDHRKLGLNMNVLISVVTSENVGTINVGRQLAAFPDVCDVYDVAGSMSYIVRAAVRDTAGLNDLIIRMGRIPGVTRTQTTLIMNILNNELSAAPPEREDAPDRG